MTEERQQIDRINTAVNSQTSLLDQALALIEGKAAGGGGGGLQVATGTFTPTNYNASSYPVKVTGLGFKPKYVIAYVTATTSYTSGTRASAWFHFAENEKPNYHGVSGSSSGGRVSWTGLGGTANTWGTLDDDGFTIKGSGVYLYTLQYSYVAIG